MSGVQPALFLGHGSPMLAIEPSRYADAWQRLGRTLPRPRAILAVSAHWYIRGTAVTAQARPRTIHDFHGFPPELYAVQYPAPGEPRLAARVAALLAPASVRLDEDWGLDHGTWAVLRHLYPEADVPVVQLSIDASLGAAQHYALAQRLGPLRDEGILVLGSGNVVHNLRALRFDAAAAPAWAQGFNAAVRAAVLERRHAALAAYESLDAGAALSVPTPEHYLPLLYVLALQRPGESATLPIDGLELGAISMLCVQVGGA
ncbi:MAG TPA: 4,5-DOPA dioxygenase extradiol [Steroidobacteraceae bacterium]|nr:4,5-DOPA dioxygenase extradiol [Steroidobacteraceae bacterium]